MTFREFGYRLRAWLRRDELSNELEREMQHHFELTARDFEQQGMSRADAAAAARRQLGNTTSQRETSRDWWGFPAVDAILGDVRYALRGLARAPGFTATVVVTLGLGIGANGAMFAVIDRLMFRPLPYLRDPSTVHAVYLNTTVNGSSNWYGTMPYTRHLDLMRATHSFEQFASVSEWRLAVGTGEDTRIRKVAAVTASLFGFFDAQPVAGRFFGAGEDVIPRGALVAVLSYEFWSAEFGARDVLGERLRIGELDFTVIGVAPADFVGAASGGKPQIFVPLTTAAALVSPSSTQSYWQDYRWDWTELLARRKPGVSEADANADLTQAYKRSRASARALNPRVMADSLVRPRAALGSVRSAAGPDSGLESRVLLWVAGVAAIVLFIACANVANLMLARVMRRSREIAVRLALGVSRARLVGQFVTEGVLLALLGGVAGLLSAQWVGAGIRALLLPEGSSFQLFTDARTIAVVVACMLASVLLTVAAPALLATRPHLASALKAGAREGGYRRSVLRSALLIAQGALSVTLLVGAGLFVRSLSNVMDIPLGYDVATVLDIQPVFRGLTFDSAGAVAVRRRLLAEAQSIPGVRYAARINSGLYGTNTTGLRVPGVDSVERLGRFNFQLSTRDYFAVMGTRILRGRGFDATDSEHSAPVVVVSEAMAQALWPGKDALGECIQVAWTSIPGMGVLPCMTVVGIAENTANQRITDTQRFMYYMLVDQVNPAWLSTIYARMTGPEIGPDVERVRRVMQAAMPGDGFVIVRPLQERVDDQRRSWRLGATLFVGFGVLALIVAAVGLYGVIGYDVAQRMHELGIRVALGARSVDIVRLVVSQGVTLALIGVAIGLGIAAVVSGWLQPLLYGVEARDPVSYGVVAAVVALVAIVASGIPAMRASRADPNRALSVE